MGLAAGRRWCGPRRADGRRGAAGRASWSPQRYSAADLAGGSQWQPASQTFRLVVDGKGRGGGARPGTAAVGKVVPVSILQIGRAFDTYDVDAATVTRSGPVITIEGDVQVPSSVPLANHNGRCGSVSGAAPRRRRGARAGHLVRGPQRERVVPAAQRLGRDRRGHPERGYLHWTAEPRRAAGRRAAAGGGARQLRGRAERVRRVGVGAEHRGADPDIEHPIVSVGRVERLHRRGRHGTHQRVRRRWRRSTSPRQPGRLCR